MPRRELCRLLGHHSPERIAELTPELDVDKAFDACVRQGMKIVYLGGEGFPEQLSDIPDPPAILFFSGSIALSELTFSVAVIGSRRCSVYGRQTARKISRKLCLSGACVVSGLARGIDGEAHRGALDGGGPTVAVMGGGIDVVYPPEHADLAKRIAANGCLVSEYPPGTKPAKYSFPERNRIISGLSRALVVVEAGERSGTMITVGTALDQGRDVFAVPGDINRSSTRGSNRLLRDGAGIVLSPEEFIAELGLSKNTDAPDHDADPVLKFISEKQYTPEKIALGLGEDIAYIRSRLLELELQGLVIRRPGDRYSRL